MALVELADLSWPLRTERLLLRPPARGDVDAVLGYRSRAEVAHWLGARPTRREDLLEGFGEGRSQNLLVELDGVVVGDVYAARQDAWAQAPARDRAAGSTAVVGWVLDPVYGGRGYATEAVRALLGVCFDGLGVRRVYAECFADNEASWRLMERVGMRREAHNVRDSLHAELGWLDGLVYALLAEDWRSQLEG
jgi:RimJ/RimL family protein N-acetyltransferase